MTRFLPWTLAFLFTLAPALSTAAIIHVSKDGDGSDPSTWAGAFQSIGAAVVSAVTGDEIWVMEGTYQGTAYLTKPVRLIGGFSGTESDSEAGNRDWKTFPTIMDAGGAQFPTLACSSDSEIDGFYLRKSNRPGLAIFDSTATVRRCNISDNHSSAGGVIITNAGVDMTDITVSSNMANQSGGGFYIWRNSTITLTDCVISGNHSAVAGGGIVCVDSIMELHDCRIEGNQADSYAGGLEIAASAATFHNCLLEKNNAPYADELRISVSENTDFLNCTIVSTPLSIGWSDNAPHFENCILWGDAGILSDWASQTPSDGASVRHSEIQGGYPGEGNISDDPKFVDAANGDFHLLPDSPCIDSASTTGPNDDLDGNPRPVDIPGIGRDGDGAFDMGCYEFQLPGPTPTPTAEPSPTMNPRSDIDRNGMVDAEDLMMLLADWKKSSAP
jgi:parallel beta-helix repeat protein